MLKENTCGFCSSVCVLIPIGLPQEVGDALADAVAVVVTRLAHRLGLSARQLVTTAGVSVELLALLQTGRQTLPALTQAGVGVQRLVPGTLCSTHTPAQLLFPALAGRAQLPLALTFTLTFTGVVGQFPARVAAVLCESVATHTLAG